MWANPEPNISATQNCTTMEYKRTNWTFVIRYQPHTLCVWVHCVRAVTVHILQTSVCTSGWCHKLLGSKDTSVLGSTKTCPWVQGPSKSNSNHFVQVEPVGLLQTLNEGARPLKAMLICLSSAQCHTKRTSRPSETTANIAMKEEPHQDQMHWNTWHILKEQQEREIAWLEVRNYLVGQQEQSRIQQPNKNNRSSRVQFWHVVLDANLLYRWRHRYMQGSVWLDHIERFTFFSNGLEWFCVSSVFLQWSQSEHVSLKLDQEKKTCVKVCELLKCLLGRPNWIIPDLVWRCYTKGEIERHHFQQQLPKRTVENRLKICSKVPSSPSSSEDIVVTKGANACCKMPLPTAVSGCFRSLRHAKRTAILTGHQIGKKSTTTWRSSLQNIKEWKKWWWQTFRSFSVSSGLFVLSMTPVK